MRFIIILFIFSLGCSQERKKGTNPEVLIETAFGDIELELYPEKAPRTVEAFLKNVDKGLYSNTNFYRVLKNENLSSQYNSGLIQGGIHRSKPEAVDSVPHIPHEPPAITGLSHVNGTISMARSEPGTASSEFFICIGDQKQFDSSKRTNPDGQGYAAFGKLIKGHDILRQIQDQKSSGEEFLQPVLIRQIKRL